MRFDLHRPAVHRQPRRLHRRADPEQRRHPRAAARLSRGAARRIARARGMLLILDEAQTGLGRTGHMFAFERDGVVPDILTLSKTLGAGLPLSAVMTTDDIAARGRGARLPVLHHPRQRPAARRGRPQGARDRASATGWPRKRAARRARGCAAGLARAAAAAIACIGDVRGRGLLLGLEFTDAGGSDAGADLRCGDRRGAGARPLGQHRARRRLGRHDAHRAAAHGHAMRRSTSASSCLSSDRTSSAGTAGPAPAPRLSRRCRAGTGGGVELISSAQIGRESAFA